MLLLVDYPEVILGIDSFFHRDFGLFTNPVAAHARESFWRGEVPLWNPLNNCGIPLLAQWNTTICYPLSWLYFLFPLPWSLNYFCLGHLVLAGVGMYRLAREWTGDRFGASVAGLAYALNGLSLNCLIWTSTLVALSWLPLVVLTGERAWRRGGRAMVVAALVGAMQMLSGSPEIIFLTWVLLGTLWLGPIFNIRRLGLGRDFGFRILDFRPVFRLTLLTALVLGLSAVQLMPFFEMLPHAQSDPEVGRGAQSMPAWGWANFLVPLFRCTRLTLGSYAQVGQGWTSSYYVGIGVLALAAVALAKARTPRVWWLGAVALSGMTLALGDNVFLYAMIQRIFAPLGSTQNPIQFVVLAIFAFPLLAAFGLKWLDAGAWIGSPASEAGARPPVALSENPHAKAAEIKAGQEHGPPQMPRVHLPDRALFWSGGLLLTGILGIVGVARLLPGPEESWRITSWNGAERALFLVLILGAVLLYVRMSSATRRGWLGFAVLLLLGLDLLTHVPPQNPLVSSQAYGTLPDPMSPLPSLGQSRAMINPRMQGWLGNTANPDPLQYYIGLRQSLFGDSNLLNGLPKVNGLYSWHLQKEVEVNALVYAPTRSPQGLLDFLGVAQLSSADEMFKWKPRPSALPWLTAGQRPLFASEARTLASLASPDFDPRRVVYLPLAASGEVGSTNHSAVEVISTNFSAHKITAELSAPTPACSAAGLHRADRRVC